MPRKTRSHKRQKAIPRATFERLVKEITADLHADKHVLWGASAIDVLHEESETLLAEHFQNAKYLCDTFEERTLGVKHFGSAKALSCPT